MVEPLEVFVTEGVYDGLFTGAFGYANLKRLGGKWGNT